MSFVNVAGAARHIPHGILTGEPGDRKRSRRVREGDAGKGPQGTSPASYLGSVGSRLGRSLLEDQRLRSISDLAVAESPQLGAAPAREGWHPVRSARQRL